jgi:hypothetical protein
MSDYSQIHALADDELTAAERAEAEARLQVCEKSRAEYETVKALKGVLQSKCEPVKCDETWAKCQERLKEIDRTKRVERLVSRYAWAMCAFFVVAIFSAGMINRMMPKNVAPSEIARLSAGFAPMSTPQPNAAVEERRKWVDGIFGKPMPVRTDSLELVKATRGFVNGVDTVRLDFVDKTGPVALFIMPSAAISDLQVDEEGYGQITVHEQSGIAWRDGEVTFFVLGNRSPELLRGAASQLRK